MQATVMCMYSWIYGIFGFRWRYVRLLKLLFRLTNRIFCWRSHFTEISVWKDSFCCSYQGIRPFSDAYGRTCLCVRLLHVSRYFLLSFSPPLSLSLLFAIRGRIDHFLTSAFTFGIDFLSCWTVSSGNSICSLLVFSNATMPVSPLLVQFNCLNYLGVVRVVN